MSNDPKILEVHQEDNAAVVRFEGEPEPAIYPAWLLYSAKEFERAKRKPDANPTDDDPYF